jgi:hypothetical protein
MDYNKHSVNEMIDMALTTSNQELMYELIQCPFMLVRRALAKNLQAPSSVIKLLLRDPVLNVSYVASKNPNCSDKREFVEEELPICVTCKVDERNMDCEHCSNKEDHRF